MLTRDSYVALLEKRASAEVGPETSVPANDSAEATNAEVAKTRADDHTYLSGLFTKAEAVQSDQSSTMKHLFPGAEGTKVYGNPFIKAAFYRGIRERNLLKTASPIHCELAFNSFCDELEKIASARSR